jgi:hypothetical protein
LLLHVRKEARCREFADKRLFGRLCHDARPVAKKVELHTVGRHCVFGVGDAAKAGALYLGINDARETVTGVQGQLEVRIEAL